MWYWFGGIIFYKVTPILLDKYIDNFEKMIYNERVKIYKGVFKNEKTIN